MAATQCEAERRKLNSPRKLCSASRRITSDETHTVTFDFIDLVWNWAGPDRDFL